MIFLIINNSIYYDYFTIGNISISKKLSLDTSKTCLTCKDYEKNIKIIAEDPCINRQDIKMSGYDTDKDDTIVTDTEFRNGACCCTDETNCDPTTLTRPEYMCNDYKILDLKNDVCKTNLKYDGYDPMAAFKTIEEYLNGECCKKAKTCKDYEKNIKSIPEDPCINRQDIKMSGYDTDKDDTIVTDTEFRNGVCCCTDETNCDPTTLTWYAGMTCDQYERLDLDKDVCNTNPKYDGYNYTGNNKTIYEYLDGECCKTK